MSSTFTYKDSGVDIDAGDALVERIKPFAKKTMRPEVLAGIGGFGALFELKKYQHPVLVTGTDGVGTKLKLAFELDVHNTIGIDLVAMSVNDILVQGAEPLFFLDYFACSKLNVDVASSVIEGIAEGCSQAKCSLIGGETAEMPDMYQDGEYDLAGFAVGVVEKSEIIDGRKLCSTDVIIGIHSSGFHSNGYSLVRKIIKHTNLDLNSAYDDKLNWGQALLEPTLIYSKIIRKIVRRITVHAMAHITGGGITGNLPRVIPPHFTAEINLNALPKTKLFDWVQEGASLNEAQMLETFNCGIGYVLIVSQFEVDHTLALLRVNDFKANIIGRMSRGTGEPIRYIRE